MFREITLGQYYPADSILHKLDPRVKLFATLIYIIGIFVTFKIIYDYLMIIKNYKELCKLLEIEPKTSNSKKAQLKELETYVDYEKQGVKFVIKKIYDKQKVKEDGRVGGYSEMRTLILRLLDMSNQNNNIVLPTNVLLRKLSMVNDNYAIARRSQKELSELLDMKQEYIADFYSSTHKNLKRALETNLNKLQR